MHSLPLFVRVSGQPVIVVGEGEAALAKRRLVERAGAHAVGEADTAARLAFVALAAPEVVAARLRQRGVLVNVVDRPELCDFTVPSVLERGPVVIAIGTGGVSAGLAKALRLRFEALLPGSLGALAAALGAARSALRTRWPDPLERRAALDSALAPDGALDPLDDFGGEPAQSAVARWLEGAAAGAAGIREFTLASADPDDLTLRQARWLGAAERIACEPGIAPAILTRARADSERIALAPGQPAPAGGRGLTVVIRRGPAAP